MRVRSIEIACKLFTGWLLVVQSAWIVAQQDPPAVVHSLGDSQPQPWTSLDLNRSEREFHFAIVSDNSGTPRFGIWREAMEKLNLLQPAFVMSVGDLIEGYVDRPELLHQQWDRFFNDLAPLERPFFFVAGNHDVGRPLWHQVYRERVGPTWYYFLYRDVLFLILDTNDGPEHSTGMSDEQLTWIQQVLQKYPASSVRWTLVFQHKPLWNDNNLQWNQVKRMLADRQSVTVIAGHIHEYMSTQIDGIEYVALATTGGGSPLRGRDAGELDHVTWVTMKDDGPVVANIELDAILPFGFRTNDSAKRYEKISSGRFLRVSPISQNKIEFQSGSTTAVLENPDSQPLRVKVLLEPPPGIVVRPASISTLLPPASKVSVDLAIDADSTMAISQLSPVVMHWQASQDRPALPSLNWSGQSRIFFDGAFEIPRTQAKNIDGKIDDWPDLPFRVDQPGEIHSNQTAWRGLEDARYRWGVAADDDRLYVAVEVWDDQTDHLRDMVWQDFAGVFVNPIVGPDAKPQQIKQEAFAVMAGISMSEDDLRRYQFGNPPADVQAKVFSKEHSVCYEFSIPTGRFNELQNGRWTQLQLNVIVNDHDPDDEREGICVMYWRPRWDGLFHYPTSGLFMRE